MPQNNFDWLLNPSVALPETDTAAAEAAIASGGMVGSPFAMNNMLRLRDSERMQRLQLGENLLQPYLNRSSAEGIAAGNQAVQRAQIAQQASSDAMRESGAMARLSAEGQQRLQLALLTGDQQAARDALQEAGQDRRQSAQLAASLQERTMTNQSSLLQSLLPYALPKGGGGGAGDGIRQGAGGTYFMGSSNLTGAGVGPLYNDSREESWRSNPMNPAASGGSGGGSGGLSGNLGPVLSRILAGYGLTA